MKQETKDQLREILCEVPEVDKDIKDPRRGCWIKYMSEIYEDGSYDLQEAVIISDWSDSDGEHGEQVCNFGYYVSDYGHEKPVELELEFIREIIGNPLQERHLRMYIKSKLNDYSMFKYPIIWNKIWIELDNTKDLEGQSEETGQKLIKFLLDNK